MIEEKCVFVDNLGERWRCRVETNVILQASIETGISLEELENANKMSIGKLLILVWHSVKKLAKAREISRVEFFEKRLQIKNMGDALKALGEALEEAAEGANPTEKKGGMENV